MAFMKKEELLEEAERLGIDADGMKYQDLVGAVAAAKRGESPSVRPVANPKPGRKNTEKVQSDEEKRKKRDIEFGRRVMNDIKNERIIIAPGILPDEKNVLFKYKENLGKKKLVQEVSFDLYSLGNPTGDASNDGTYRIVGETDEDVIATASYPKENARIEYTPMGDWFPVIVDPKTGKRGYQLKRYVIPYLNRAGMLGRYMKYFDNKRYPNNCFYLGGWSCVDKDLVDWIFEDIKQNARERDDD